MIITAIAGAILGAGTGYLVSKNLSRFTGGVCPLMCKPGLAVPYFAFIGMLVAVEVFGS